jgi:cobalt/nickel transport system permease protein
MHIAEGYLPLAHCAAWAALSAPAVGMGARPRALLAPPGPLCRADLVAAVAYGLLLTSLKLPSVAGSSSHPTGLALGTLLLGPMRMAPVAFAILVLQALFLGHGGLTTLGANTVALGIAGPWVVWAVVRGAHLLRVPPLVAVAFAATAGDLATYLMTASQLALAHPARDGGVWGAWTGLVVLFGVTQLPIALLEGALTAIAWRVLAPARWSAPNTA